MTTEESLKTQLQEQFGFLGDKITNPRARRLWTEYLPADDFHAVLAFAVDKLKFVHLCTITGIDEKEFFGIIYHLAREDGVVLNLKLNVAKSDPRLRSVNPLFPGSANYERELEDLLGLKVEGLPEGKRYPLPDDWPQGQFPLRKDWSPEMLSQEAKSNV